jgi:hypothetical protein
MLTPITESAIASPVLGGSPRRSQRLTAEAAGRLQADGLIEYRRGRITVLDRDHLEARVCECYAVVKKEYDRLLGPALRPHA